MWDYQNIATYADRRYGSLMCVMSALLRVLFAP
jgi:hypothetical protein